MIGYQRPAPGARRSAFSPDPSRSQLTTARPQHGSTARERGSCCQRPSRAPLWPPVWPASCAAPRRTRSYRTWIPRCGSLLGGELLGIFFFSGKTGVASAPFAANLALGGTPARLIVGPALPAASLARNRTICTFGITIRRSQWRKPLQGKQGNARLKHDEIFKCQVEERYPGN